MHTVSMKSMKVLGLVHMYVQSRKTQSEYMRSLHMWCTVSSLWTHNKAKQGKCCTVQAVMCLDHVGLRRLQLTSLMRQPLSSCCYYCAIAKDRVWWDSPGYCVLCRKVGRPIRCRNRRLWLMHHFDCGTRLKTYCCLPYRSLWTPQSSWKTGSRGIGLPNTRTMPLAAETAIGLPNTRTMPLAAETAR